MRFGVSFGLVTPPSSGQTWQDAVHDAIRSAPVLEGLASHELVADCRVGGFLGAVEVASHLHGNVIADELIERGFVSRPLPGNALQISPPLIAEDQEIVNLVDAIRDVLDAHN